MYADDIVLLSADPAQLDRMLLHVAEYARRRLFHFSPKKCNVVVASSSAAIRAAGAMRQWVLDGTALEGVEWYRYLGVEIGKIGRGKWNMLVRSVVSRGAVPWP